MTEIKLTRSCASRVSFVGSLGFSGVKALLDTDDADFTEKRGYFFDLSMKIRQSVESVYPNPA